MFSNTPKLRRINVSDFGAYSISRMPALGLLNSHGNRLNNWIMVVSTTRMIPCRSCTNAQISSGGTMHGLPQWTWTWNLTGSESCTTLFGPWTFILILKISRPQVFECLDPALLDLRIDEDYTWGNFQQDTTRRSHHSRPNCPICRSSFFDWMPYLQYRPQISAVQS